MKRIIKNKNSEVLKLKLLYPKDSKKIRDILEKEQGGYCAYTESKIKATSAIDVEHFNPKLKLTKKDNYYNWFAVGHKWNNKKSNKWDKFQPVLNPTAKDFEERLIYDCETACYICNPTDIETVNLIELLNLNDKKLIESRNNEINLLNDLFNESSNKSFIDWLSKPKSKDDLIEYRRAIETVFNISLS